MADAISRIHDPTHYELFVQGLTSTRLQDGPTGQPHMSCNAFNALPLQVQSRLRSNNLMQS